jgi:hypothetical protein
MINIKKQFLIDINKLKTKEQIHFFLEHNNFWFHKKYIENIILKSFENFERKNTANKNIFINSFKNKNKDIELNFDLEIITTAFSVIMLEIVEIPREIHVKKILFSNKFNDFYDNEILKLEKRMK